MKTLGLIYSFVLSLCFSAGAQTVIPLYEDSIPGEVAHEDKEYVVKGQNSIQNYAWGDDLVATDALNRTLPVPEECSLPKQNHYVGLFYWLWHDELRNSISDDIDVTKILSKNPTKTDWRMEDYYWAEPELGYYRADDSWVLRKHLSLFSLLGIDFLYLDFTNAIVNAPELTALLNVMLDMKSKGYPVPRLVPFLNHEPNPKIEQLYDDFYTNPTYADCWFYWEGKPLILSPKITSISPYIEDRLNEIQNFFTWRTMWATFPKEESDNGKWRFFDDYPPRPAYNNGVLEQTVISKGFGGPVWDNPIYGSSSSTSTYTPTYNQYWVTEETGTGNFFEEQWTGAHNLQAPVLCITGWNEWKAGAWPVDEGLYNADFTFQNRRLSVGDMYFVDEFNTEFNRDLEPMKGGYSDNFFYQMAAELRKYKGMQPREKAQPANEVNIDGDFSEWSEVKPIFRDFEGDVASRDADGAPRNHHYANYTGRNDIVESRVSYDAQHVYFYVKTAENMSSSNDKNWMLLYIDQDKNKQTGWEGYDFVINMEVLNASTTTLKKWNNGNWETVSEIVYQVSGKQMEIEVNKYDLNIPSGDFEIYFHWVDNIQKIGDITKFFVNGDSAPERRYNYDYNTVGGKVSTSVKILKNPLQTMNTKKFEVPVYPNPAYDIIHVDFSGNVFAHSITLRMYNACGKMVKHEVVSGNADYTLDTANWPR